MWNFTTFFLWLHLLALLLWVGGLFFELLTLYPAAGRSEDAATYRLLGAAEIRFGAVAWAAVLLLVVSGLFNLFNRMNLGGLTRQHMTILAVKVAALVLLIVIQHIRVTVFARHFKAAGESVDGDVLSRATSSRSVCIQLVCVQLSIAMIAVYFGLALRGY
mgnify:CR=1 FL=1